MVPEKAKEKKIRRLVNNFKTEKGFLPFKTVKFTEKATEPVSDVSNVLQ